MSALYIVLVIVSLLCLVGLIVILVLVKRRSILNCRELRGKVLIDNFHPYIKTSWNNVPRKHKVLKVVFVCWFGRGKEIPTLSENRAKALHDLIHNVGVDVILLTPVNLKYFEVPGFPIHRAFDYLSGNHKSDYLRAYLLHHYGGCYQDIKSRQSGISQAWDHFQNEDIWIVSRSEKHPSHIGYPVDEGEPARSKFQSRYRELGTMCSVICRPKTPYTNELLFHINKTLDTHLKDLIKYPASSGRCCYSDTPFSKAPSDSYPLRYLQIMGEAFHPLMLKYQKHMVLDDRMDFSSQNYV